MYRVDDACETQIRKNGGIVAIYLLPEIWGSGQGNELLQYSLGKLKKKGFQNICLWVLKII